MLQEALAHRAQHHEEYLEECEFCGGANGEHHDITTMEYVYPGEPHMAPIGTQRCPNSINH